MDPRLNEAEIAHQQRARQAAARSVAPAAASADSDVAAPREALAGLGEAGLLGTALPEDAGGAGGGLVELALAAEEIGAASASVASIFVGHIAAAGLLAASGSEAQKAGLLGDLASGAKIAAFGLDGAVSPLDEPRAAAVVADATISGTVNAVAGATVADVFVFGAHGEGDDEALQWFVVAASEAGLTVGAEEAKLGLNGSGLAAVDLASVSAGSDAHLASGSSAEDLAAAALDCARIGHAALCIGIGRAAFEAATRHVAASETGLAKAQSIQWMLADMATETEAARLVTWHAASRTKLDELREGAAMARLMAADAAVRATRSAVQIFGSAGSTRQAGIERLYRDAKAMEVHHGAREAQQRAVARQLLPDLVG